MAHEDEHIGDRHLSHWKSWPGRVLAAGATRAFARPGEFALLLVIMLVGSLVMGLLTWTSGELYEAVSQHDGVALFDQPVLSDMVAVRESWLTVFAYAFTTVGGPIAEPILAAIVAVWLSRRWRSWTPLLLMVIAGAGSLTMTVVGKNYIDRVRPPHVWAVPPYEWSPSFPSGHALNSVVIGGLIAYLLVIRAHRKRTRWFILGCAILFALLMGLSRVYLGHHWLTDVLVGWALGGAWLTLIITGHRLVLTLRERTQRPAAGSPDDEPAVTP
ncbi:MAG: phosphatase PAP2 family protein [Micrococcales bacterium]|nr:phosphatase PAP2 family protein [Micrococcales bacterium]